MTTLLARAAAGAAIGVSVTAFSLAARAEPPVSEAAATEVAPAPVNDSDVPRERRTLPSHEAPPVLLYTFSAFGAPARSLGLHTTFGGATQAERPVRGEFSVWGSPIDRLTLMATAGSRANGEWAPALTVAGRILGSREDGWALGASGAYKAEGFAEMEGEIELGLLFSLQQRRFHADVNAVAGGGLEEEEERDVEGKLRFGYDVADWARVGFDGRVRHRASGPRELIGGRTSDAAAGAEFLASTGRVYGVVLAGVSTVDVASGVSPLGWIGVGALAL